MRFVGLTLCLLASSFAARAEAAEDRLATLEERVKTLEQALLEAGRNLPPASLETPRLTPKEPKESDAIDLIQIQ